MTGWMEKRIKAEKIYVQVAVAGVMMKIKKSSRGSLEDERKKMAKVLKQKFLEGVAKKDGTALDRRPPLLRLYCFSVSSGSCGSFRFGGRLPGWQRSIRLKDLGDENLGWNWVALLGSIVILSLIITTTCITIITSQNFIHLLADDSRHDVLLHLLSIGINGLLLMITRLVIGRRWWQEVI